ncbi:FOG: Ankyrin repeat [Plasmopara halstedii]|uniref:FOG: Ankyrin repeat n=1 Tax=Plasmopara halstedii TaxID=4781 RepID=A0A0P1AQM2_PLAHL|nr:FOG: Ankyrin repeat [Plasmopara halstedii]CEG43432.1 FOG: Ankyrin repeat [Plasmopara halstedii]|eukprot:XP_024579801.1 FOG: Ankyrin repeat [Plasmopara halstedii]
MVGSTMLVLTTPSLFRFVMTFIDGVPGRVLSLINALQHDQHRVPWSATGFLPRDAIQRGDLDTLRHLYRLSTTKTYKLRPELSFDGAVCFAIQLGRFEMVQYLVTIAMQDKTEHFTDQIGGSTLLGWAIRYSNVLKSEHKVEIVEWVAKIYSKSALKDVNADDLSRAGIFVLTFLKERGLATTGFTDPKLVDLVAGGGNLVVLRFLFERENEDRQVPRCTSDAMDKAAMNGHLQIVQYLHEQSIGGCTVAAMDGAAKNGYLDVVKFLHAQRSEGCTVSAMDGAARSGHLEIVTFLHTNRREGCTTAAMDGAATRGYLEIVQYLHEHRSEGCTTNAMNGAAQSGHLDVITYLHNFRTEGCTTDAMDGAALVGNLSVVKFLHENRKEGCTSNAIDGAAWRGHFDVVQYLVRHRSEGCTFQALDTACQSGNLNIVRVLHENGDASCTTKAMDNAASSGHLEIVRYLHENRIEGCTKDAMTNAAIHGYATIVQYLGEHRHEGAHEYTLERAAALGNVQCVDALLRYSIQGCLFEARCAALDAGHSRVAILLSAWINPDVQTCCLRKYHVRPGPRWCQKPPRSEKSFSVTKQTGNESMTSCVVTLLRWFQ